MRYPNKGDVDAVLSCMDGRMTIGEIAESSGVSRRKVPVALKALAYQNMVRSRKAGKHRLYYRK